MSAKINDGLTRCQRHRLKYPERAAAQRKAWYAKNREAVLAAAKTNVAKKLREAEYRKENAEKEKARVEAWAKANPEKGAKRTARYRLRHPDAWSKQYQRDPLKYAVKAVKRRAQKKNATPIWANEFFIKEAYHLAKLRTKMTGFKWEVDHIYPLESDVVCGLHVEHNLQVIPQFSNRSKGNKVIHHG